MLFPAAAPGGARLDVAVGTIEGEGWRAEGVDIALEVRTVKSLAAVVTADALELPEPLGRVEDVRGECAVVEFEGARVRCRGLRLLLPLEGLPPVTGEATFDRNDKSLALDLSVRAGTGGEFSISGQLARGGWRAALRAEEWPLATLGGWLPATPAGGRVSGNAELAGRAGGLERLTFSTRMEAVAVSSEDGTLAADGLGLRADGEIVMEGGGLRARLRLETEGGEAYLEPVYADLGRYPVEMRVEGRWDGHLLEIGVPSFTQAGVMSGQGQAWLERGDQGWRVSAGLLEIGEAVFPGAYAVVLQPYLAATGLADLETGGRLSAQARIADGAMRYVSVSLEEVDLDDRAQGLAIYGLTGELSWAPQAADVPVRPVTLAWGGGFLFGIPFGPSRLGFEAGPGGWVLETPARIPILDGALAIHEFSLGDFTEGNARVRFDAEVEPIGMRGLSRALDWPPMSGTLSGTLPELTYLNGNLTVGGVLEAQVFDGRVRVSSFQLRDPFQEGSLLRGELELEGLDLEQVTEAFSFGRITGTLNGYVRDLEIIDWAAVAFDARFFTPTDDARRHRISQRAVDNIASLGGGGGAAALSKGFLRFFEEFGYDRMALGCRLVADVCHMTGVEPAKSGYYILTGSGLPRIEVVGFADRVSWPTLVGQLKAIVESEGPVVR